MLQTILNHPYTRDTCFLCGETFDEKNGSREHVFPKWLQHEFGLWNRRITLINQSKISYKDIVIPCCAACNNTTLSQLESKIKNAFSAGYEGVIGLNELDLFLWCAKLFLGLIYKEKFLKMDVRDYTMGNITNEGLLQNYAMLHFWIKNFKSSNLNNFIPGSVFVFEAQEVKEKQDRFAILDDIETSFFMIRIGNVIAIAHFLDNGLHRLEMESSYAAIKTISLHPMQVKEMVAIALYNAQRLKIKTTTTFQNSDAGGLYISVQWEPLGENYWEEWSTEQFLLIYANISGISPDALRDGATSYKTFLFDQQGDPLFWKNGEGYPQVG